MLCSAACLRTYGQTTANRADSLLSSLQRKELHDTTRINTLYLLSAHLQFRKPDTAYTLAGQALELSEKAAYSRGHINALNLLGSIESSQGAHEKARDRYLQALELSKRHELPVQESHTLGALAILAKAQGEYTKAIGFFEQALAISQTLQDRDNIARNFNNIGVVYLAKGDHKRAISHFLEAISIKKKMKDWESVAVSYSNIGLVYTNQEEYEPGLKYMREALKIYEQIGDSLGISDIYNNMGYALKESGRLQEAVPYLQRSLRAGKSLSKCQTVYAVYNLGSVYERMDSLSKSEMYLQKALETGEACQDQYIVILTLDDLSKNYFKQKRTGEARKLAERSLEIAQQIGRKGQIQTSSQTLYQIAKAEGRWEEALRYHELTEAYADSIKNEEKARQIGKLEARYEFAEREQELELQQKIQQAELESERTINTLLGMGLALLALLSAGMMRLYFQKEKAHQELQKSKAQEVQKNEELNRLNHELEATVNLVNKQKTEIEQKNTNITASLVYASRIQRAILPFHERIRESLNEYFILYQPRDIVSGDFYYFRQVGQDLLWVVADCTGHGVPGAFMSLIGNELLNDIVLQKQITEPAQILKLLDKNVQRALQQDRTNNQDGMEVAVCRISPEAQKMEFAGAGRPLIYFQKQQLHYLKGDRIPIGGIRRQQKQSEFTTHQISLQEETAFYLFSDGYQDQFGGEHNKKFGLKRFKKLLQEVHPLPMGQQEIRLEKKLADWMQESEEKQIDDILVLGARLKP